MSGWSWVTIGVGNLDQALTWWVERFGFEIESRSDEPDRSLEQHWDLGPGSIKRQALVRAQGCTLGKLHFVEFREPEETVRARASVFDLCPKNLDIYVNDMPRRVAELRAAGVEFRTDTYSEVTAPNGVRFREIHLPGHDDINFVLLELLDEHVTTGPMGYSGIGPLVTIVSDPEPEKAFYRDHLGLEILHDNILDGPAIEKMIGLPTGSALNVSIWGKPDQHLGQVEIIAYMGTHGANLYPRAKPGARGIFQLNWSVADIDLTLQKLSALGTSFADSLSDTRLFGPARTLRLLTPAGFSLEIHQPL